MGVIIRDGESKEHKPMVGWSKGWAESCQVHVHKRKFMVPDKTSHPSRRGVPYMPFKVRQSCKMVLRKCVWVGSNLKRRSAAADLFRGMSTGSPYQAKKWSS